MIRYRITSWLEYWEKGEHILDLPPEEKQRIYAEEKARQEAQEKVKQERDTKNSKTGCIELLLQL